VSYRFEYGETVSQALRRIADEQLDRAVGTIRSGVDLHEVVHDVRKRLKKLRALLRIFRPSMPETYSAENGRFRDIGRELSDARDAQSALGALDGLQQARTDLVEPETCAPIRARLEENRDRRAAAPERVRPVLAGAMSALVEARERVGEWNPDGEGFGALSKGLERTYRRARNRMSDAYFSRPPATEAFHEWRKRAKYHRYHVRLLRTVWPPILNARREELHALTDLLGDEHDLAMLGGALRHDPASDSRRLESLLGLIEQRREMLRARARPLGRKLFAEKPKACVRRFAAYWEHAIPTLRTP
jgi:CHAD domain-containing protein